MVEHDDDPVAAQDALDRLLEPIGNVPPAEAEARYYAELETRAVAA